MELFPAIDLFGQKAVRLLHGDYAKMTVYNDNPLAVAEDFAVCGAKNIHMVDLEGAKDGTTPNISVVSAIAKTGALRGTNRELYRRLNETYQLDFIASGGVSSMEDVQALAQMKLYGAIIGKAYYTGAIDLRKAIEVTA